MPFTIYYLIVASIKYRICYAKDIFDALIKQVSIGILLRYIQSYVISKENPVAG